MPLRTLDHCSIRTVKLEKSRKFYIDVLDMVEGDRPDFPFPGTWLYVDGHTVIHLVGVDPNDPRGLVEYLGGDIDPETLNGSGSFDHIAFRATAAPTMIERLTKNNVSYRERHVPNMDLYQLFLEDPNGITIELNYFSSEQ
jgi:catechol 2,3-dioxygenase-like lactoylglutathione lyase family enzyme